MFKDDLKYKGFNKITAKSCPLLCLLLSVLTKVSAVVLMASIRVLR